MTIAITKLLQKLPCSINSWRCFRYPNKKLLFTVLRWWPISSRVSATCSHHQTHQESQFRLESPMIHYNSHQFILYDLNIICALYMAFMQSYLSQYHGWLQKPSFDYKQQSSAPRHCPHIIQNQNNISHIWFETNYQK